MIIKIEKDKLLGDFFKEDGPVMPLLYALYSIEHESSEHASTGNVYKAYERVCEEYDIKPLTEGSISRIISRLVKIKALKAEPISLGRYGRTRIISFDRLR